MTEMHDFIKFVLGSITQFLSTPPILYIFAFVLLLFAVKIFKSIIR